MIKLLAVDMDGTCLDSKGRMSPTTLDALKKAADSGITVVPATGRNVTCLPKALKKESFYRYAISSNGALVVDLKEDKELFKAYIDSETAASVLEKCKGMLIFKAAHMDRDYFVQGRILQYVVKRFFDDDSIDIFNVSNMAKYIREKGKSVEEFQFFYRNEGYREKIKEIIAPYPDVCAAYSKGYAEIYNKHGSKGTALLALAEKLGIAPDEIACIGDEENDISMFSVAGMPLAMGNAIQQLKEKAKIVLPTNDENGVAEAVYKHILPFNA